MGLNPWSAYAVVGSLVGLAYVVKMHRHRNDPRFTALLRDNDLHTVSYAALLGLSFVLVMLGWPIFLVASTKKSKERM